MSDRTRSTPQAACAVIFLIAIASCKDQNSGLQQSQSLIQPSVSPSVSIAVPAPQETLQTAPTPYPPNTKYKPPEGYVPDARTAIRIAEAVWIPIYGQETLKDEKPFVAHLVNGVWIVRGTLPKGWRGGTAYAEISKETGQILNVTHFR